MILDRNKNKEVVVLLGAGSMGCAIVRRIAAGKKILLGDISEKALERVSHEFTYSGYDVETQLWTPAMKSQSGNLQRKRLLLAQSCIISIRRAHHLVRQVLNIS